MILLYLILGAIGGFLSGLSGLSPGSLLAPILIIVLSTPYDTAINATLMVVFFTSLFSYFKGVSLPPRTLVAVGIPSALFALLGDIYLRHFALPVLVLEFLLAAMMFLGADLSWMSKRKRKEGDEGNQSYSGLLVWLGSLSGLTTSLLGLSGSIFMTPLLNLKTHLSYKEAMRISSVSAMVASLFALSGEIFYQELPYSFAFYLIIGALIGAFLGGGAQKHIEERHLLRFNYWIFIFLGFFVLIRLFFNSF